MAQIHRGLLALNAEGTTIFLTTYNMEEATALCNRVAFLDNGNIQELDNPDALSYKHSNHAFHVETVDGENLMFENEPKNADKIRELIARGRVKAMLPTIQRRLSKKRWN